MQQGSVQLKYLLVSFYFAACVFANITLTLLQEQKKTANNKHNFSFVSASFLFFWDYFLRTQYKKLFAFSMEGTNFLLSYHEV